MLMVKRSPIISLVSSSVKWYQALWFICALVWFYGCSENSIGDYEINGGQKQIQGQVRLSNNLSPENVYVWLEGFDMGTRTDGQGNFRFILPTAASSNGVTGAFELYYFLANFYLETSEVFVRDGNFLYSLGEINSEGRLNQPKFLSRRLRIETRVQPESISIQSLGTSTTSLQVDVFLQAITDSVIVFFPGVIQGIRGPLLFRNIERDETLIKESIPTEFVESALDTIDSSIVRRTMNIKLTPKFLPVGEYEVIPYILIQDIEVPQRLIESLGNNVEALSQQYPSLPMKREGDRFLTITP